VTLSVGSHVGPWSEDEYLALDTSADRIELLDGSLIVSPAPSAPHQQFARRLANALEAAAPPDLAVVEAVNVRLGAGRIAIPDVVVVADDTRSVYEAAEVALVAEVTSPGNAGTDRVLKMQLYALSGIRWYLLAQSSPPQLRLFRLDGEHYVAAGQAEADQVLRLPAPFPADLTPAALTRRTP
jgi:Uma2 family endonuclease